ncbi:MAG: AAA family ATPase [Candidatus Cyclobacteriaceae bacterium M2_1C_046]
MIVMVLGLPGSGKTYFAKRLAGKINAVHISSDRIRNELMALGKYSKKEKLAVYNKMIQLTAESLVSNKNIVVDATFYLSETREMFYNLAKKENVEIQLIVMEADEKLIKERVTKPREDSEADLEVYKKIKEQFEPVNSPHLTLNSTNNNLNLMLKKATEYIGHSNE